MVMPRDYKRALEELKAVAAADAAGESSILTFTPAIQSAHRKLTTE